MERFNILFENFKTIVEQYVDFSVVVYGAVALGILIVVGMVVRSIRLKALKKSLQEAETRFQSIKSTPLLFKLNKAVALARVNDSVNQAIDDCKVDFETVQEQIKTCSAMLGEVDDLLYVRKRKAARNVYNKLDAILSEVEAGSARVLDLLDDVLQQENIQREQINVQKEEFRGLKKEFVEHANLYNDAYAYIETKLLQVEKMFSTFEEWMFASEFNKASEQQQEIIAALAELVVLQEALPPLFEKAKGVVPALLEHTSYEYLNARNKGIQLDQYEISQNLDVISSLLQEDLGRLRNGETHQIMDHMLESEKRLAQINESIQKETRFYDEVQNRYPELEEQLLNLGISLDKLKALYARVSERFGFENWETRLASMDEQFTRMVVERAELKTMVDAGHVAYSVIHVTFKQLDNSMQVMYNDLTQMSEKLESACSDESRGQKQLVKLQVILNDIKISIHKHHLPSISAKYQEDLQYANLYVKDVVDALDMVPMDVADLNEKVKVAIDYVYKLYNNVNNLVGVASLVEETICLGNRYRTTMPDVDSALTRAELCFRNGEYTKALKIAVSTIEKIHPGAYEKILAKAPANA